MVIRFIIKDSERPVKLFGEEEADHPMGESEFGEGKFPIGPGINGVREAKGATDNKY